MNEKNFTVAIYSGNIPSTTFIENLIEGMAEAGLNILLFGKKTADVSYKGNVKVLASPQKMLPLAMFVARQGLRLFLRDKMKFRELLKSGRSRFTSARYLFRDLGAMLPILNAQPDVFHVQWAKTVQVYPELFELLDGKIAVSLRGAHINYSPLNDPGLAETYSKIFPNVNAFHAVSEDIAREAEKYGADRKRITVIHSSVRDSLIDDETINMPETNKLEIISVGRFHWKKGYHYGLDAMRILKQKNVDFHYTIVAQGEMTEEIIFLLNEYELKDNVTIIPGLKYDKLIENMKTSHMLLLPSVEEGIANVVLEAMALGIPVITTDCGGMDEVVRDNENGFIVNVRDPSALAEKILELKHKSKSELKEMIHHAKETIRNEFSRAKQIENFVAFYNRIAAG